MSTSSPIIANTQFGIIDRDQIAPSVDDVAVLERTRTTDGTGAEQGTFTTTTRPTASEAQGIIDQATQAILSRLPAGIPAAFYDRVRHAIALYSAVLIEGSFYREQLNQGSVSLYMGLIDTLMQTISDMVGGQRQGRRVDSIVLRGTEAEYSPYYPLPPPRQIIELPATS